MIYLLGSDVGTRKVQMFTIGNFDGASSTFRSVFQKGGMMESSYPDDEIVASMMMYLLVLA